MKYRQILALLTVISIITICGLLQYRRSFNPEVRAYDEESSCPLLITDSYSEDGGYCVRHCVTNRILGKTPRELETVAYEVSEGTSAELAEKRKSSFVDIFKSKEWIPKEERQHENYASGPGSTLLFAQEVISALHSIISQLKRELRVDRIRLLDIPCGDMVWMSRFLQTRDDVQYTGFDIVPDLILRHQKDYAKESNWSFRVQDIVRDGLNDSYDLILCRHMLQHLFTQDVLTVLKHFSESGSRYLFTTSFSRANVNRELSLEVHRFREQNLELPPFSLIPPRCVTRDGEKEGGGKNHFLGLWQLPLRRAKLCNSTVPFKVPSIDANFYSCVSWS